MSAPESKDRRYTLREMSSLMWPLIAPHQRWIIIVSLTIPLGVLGQTLQPLLLQQTIDGSLTQGDPHRLLIDCSLFAALVFVAFLLKSIGTHGLQLIGIRSLVSLRRKIFTHIMSQGQRFFDQRTTGALMTRTTQDVNAIGESLTRGVIGLISDALLIIGLLGMMLWLNPTLTLVSFMISPIIIWMINLCRKRLRSIFGGIRRALSELNGVFTEYIQGASETQRYRAQAQAEERFDRFSVKFRNLYYRANWWDAGLYAVMDGLSALSVGLMIAYVAYGATDWSGIGLIEGVSVGLLVALIDALNRVYVPIREFSGRLASIQRALAALDRILSLLNTHDEIEVGDHEIEQRQSGQVQGSFHFKDVFFHYGDSENDSENDLTLHTSETSWVLQGVNFTVSPGEVVAIVGSTGSGKSTIARLLSRQYQGYQGEIKLDGVSIEDLDPISLRRSIVVVTQDPILFEASIAENIHLWDADLAQDQTRIQAAAKSACAHPWIEALPEGYQSRCSRGGANLSVGQRQLLTIARAFARQAPIVILDEATASVDALTEQLIDQATAQLFAERTVLVIAHRLSTITKADRVLMLSEGQIIEEGSHDELFAQRGAYYELVQTELQQSSASI